MNDPTFSDPHFNLKAESRVKLEAAKVLFGGNIIDADDQDNEELEAYG